MRFSAFPPIGRIDDLVWPAFVTHQAKGFASSPSGELAMKKKQRPSRTKALSAAELDAMHDAGVDLSAQVDVGKAGRPGRAVQRVNV